VCLAGPEAQRRYSPRSVRHQQFSADYGQAVDLALKVNGSGEQATAYLKWLGIVTRKSVAVWWPQIEKVAHALFARGALTTPEIAAVLRPPHGERERSQMTLCFCSRIRVISRGRVIPRIRAPGEAPGAVRLRRYEEAIDRRRGGAGAEQADTAGLRNRGLGVQASPGAPIISMTYEGVVGLQRRANRTLIGRGELFAHIPSDAHAPWEDTALVDEPRRVTAGDGKAEGRTRAAPARFGRRREMTTVNRRRV
jgi:hypothetical protein